MITAKEFLNKWDKEIFGIVEFDRDIVSALKIPQESKVFLIEGGLPESAAPFISFESSREGGAMRLTEKYEIDNSFSKYIYLGFNSSGDPICITEPTGIIVYIDHENPENEYFINSSIPQLVECILSYAEFIERIKEVNGREAFLENNAPKHLIEWINEKIQLIDMDALKEDCFWKEELSRYEKFKS